MTIGKRTLHFMLVPNLHWPDTMCHIYRGGADSGDLYDSFRLPTTAFRKEVVSDKIRMRNPII